MTRLDQALVERGLCESREQAKRAVLAGRVRVNAQTAGKPSDSVGPEDKLTLDAPEKYVSRGGPKLEHALKQFQLNLTGQIAVDLGASTGGFTDCLLQHGAAKVFAVDVGKGQLAWKLRQDPRVVVMEKTNARHLTPQKLFRAGASMPSRSVGGTTSAPTGVDIVTIDCSFISLRKILPAALPLLRPGGNIVALVKPQFEAGKVEADKGRGVIRDAAIHERVLAELRKFVSEESGLCWRNVIESPLTGPAGNKEFLVLIEKSR